MSLSKINKELKKLEQEYTNFRVEHNKKVSIVQERYKNLYHTCVSCNKKSQLKNLVLVKERWWPNYEDYTLDTGNRYIICPHCFVMTRYYREEDKENLVLHESTYHMVIDHLPEKYNPYRRKVYTIYGKNVTIESLTWKNVPSKKS